MKQLKLVLRSKIRLFDCMKYEETGDCCLLKPTKKLSLQLWLILMEGVFSTRSCDKLLWLRASWEVSVYSHDMIRVRFECLCTKLLWFKQLCSAYSGELVDIISSNGFKYDTVFPLYFSVLSILKTFDYYISTLFPCYILTNGSKFCSCLENKY